MEHGDDGDTNCCRCTWNDPQRIGKETSRLRNQRRCKDHPNYCITKISQNTEKSAFGTVTKGLLKGLGSWLTCGDYPNYCIIENGQNIEKSPGDLRRLEESCCRSNSSGRPSAVLDLTLNNLMVRFQ